jgi:[acyl-carrier-protein] S-malonyltransferase
MSTNSTQTLFMFPGQGSQYPSMGKEWFQQFRVAQLAFEEASDHSGIDLKKLCFDGSETDLKSTEMTQPAILVTTVAIWRSLAANYETFSKLTDAALFAGHSLGEYSALVCSGFFDLGPIAKVVRLRGAYMQEAVPKGVGTMAALMFKPKTLETSEKAQMICSRAVQSASGEWVEPANFNTPEQIVISGTVAGVQKALEIGAEPEFQLKRGLELSVSAPFHSRLMQPAVEKLAPFIESLKVSDQLSGVKKLIPNVTAQIMNLQSENNLTIKKNLNLQITGAVRWVESIQEAAKHSALEAIEVGPGSVLAGLVKRIDATLKTSSIDKISTANELFKN